MSNPRVIVGVTGSIAAYKTASVVRRLIGQGFEVKVVMTKSACRFVEPLTFETLSRNPVYTDIFPAVRQPEVLHISLAQWADLLLIAPTTANMIGKIASGIADDLLSTVAMVCPAPKVLAPSMETHMLENPVVTGNIKKLREFGYLFVEPGEGALASGSMGRGRMAEPTVIVSAVEERLQNRKTLNQCRARK